MSTSGQPILLQMFASWLPHYRSSVPALVLSLTCTSAVGAQQANLNDISFQTEPEQRSQFDESSFIFPFAEVDSQNQGSNLRGLFVNTEPALGTSASLLINDRRPLSCA